MPTISFAGVTDVPAEAWAIVERRSAVVRRRPVVPRPARVRPPGAAALRRRDEPVVHGAGRGPDGRACRPRAGPRPLRDRRPSRGVGLDGRLGVRRRSTDREPDPLLVARRAARAVAGRPRRRTQALHRAAPAPARRRLPGAGRHRLDALPLGADTGRRGRPRSRGGRPGDRAGRARGAGHRLPRHACCCHPARAPGPRRPPPVGDTLREPPARRAAGGGRAAGRRPVGARLGSGLGGSGPARGARPAVLAVRRLRCAARDRRGDPDRGPAARGEVRRRAGAARQPARPASLTPGRSLASGRASRLARPSGSCRP